MERLFIGLETVMEMMATWGKGFAAIIIIFLLLVLLLARAVNRTGGNVTFGYVLKKVIKKITP